MVLFQYHNSKKDNIKLLHYVLQHMLSKVHVDVHVQCTCNNVRLPVFISFQVYVEFDDLEWEKREWVKVYEDFATFLVEYQLVWAKRKDPSQTQGSKIKQIQWPALVRHLRNPVY